VEAAVSVYDGGFAERPEDEREGDWVDPLDGEVPGQPARTVDDPEPWKSHDWHDGPEYRLWRKILEDEDEE
jgi:hypothetical protein